MLSSPDTAGSACFPVVVTPALTKNGGLLISSRRPHPSTPRVAYLALIIIFLLFACTPAKPSASSATQTAMEPAAPPSRTLVLAGRAEIPSLASKPLHAFGLAS